MCLLCMKPSEVLHNFKLLLRHCRLHISQHFIHTCLLSRPPYHPRLLFPLHNPSLYNNVLIHLLLLVRAFNHRLLSPLRSWYNLCKTLLRSNSHNDLSNRRAFNRGDDATICNDAGESYIFAEIPSEILSGWAGADARAEGVGEAFGANSGKSGLVTSVSQLAQSTPQLAVIEEWDPYSENAVYICLCSAFAVGTSVRRARFGLGLPSRADL